MSEKRRRKRIPGPEDWLGFESDLDVRHAHRLLFGRSIEEAQQHFGGVRSIERADELLHMPRGAFRYYVKAFARFVTSQAAAGDADSASPFLRLLLNREQRDPGSVAEVYEDLATAIEFVASHQEHFLAKPAIYGSFRDLAAQIETMCRNQSGRGR